MTFVQSTTGSGGWPLNVFLTPDLKPFYGGTYFPPEDRHGRAGFPAILHAIARGWETEREKLVAESERVIGTLRGEGAGIVYISHRLDEVAVIADRVMRIHDGFGEADSE